MDYEYDNNDSFSDQADKLRDKGTDRLFSSEGDVLGGLITLPKPIAVVLKSFAPAIMQRLTSWVKEPSAKVFTQAAKTLKFSNPEHVGGKVSQGLVYTLPYTLNIIDFVKTAKDHATQKKALLAELSPLLSANKQSHKSQGKLASLTNAFDSGYGDNKMVQYSLAQLKHRTYNKLGMNAVSILPNFIINYGSGVEQKLADEGLKSPPNEALIAKLDKKLQSAKFWVTGTGPLAQTINEYSQSKQDAKCVETSLRQVFDLQRLIKDDNLDNPHSTQSTEALGAVASKVEDIFQTYQKERGLKHIPMHRMREVSKLIAEDLVAGDLTALSLVNIVGNERLLTSSKDGLLSNESIEKVLKQEVKVFSKSSAVTSEDFMKDRPFGIEDIKVHLQSKDKDERALAMLLAPESVLLEAGAKKQEIQELRNHLSVKIQEEVFTAVIGALARQTDEQLAEKSFSREAIMFIREHDSREEGAETVKHALQTRGTADAVKDAVLTELMGESSQKWQSYIASVKKQAHESLQEGGKHATKHVKHASHTDRAASTQDSTQEINK